MMFVVTLVHPPELCLSRKEFGTEAKRWIDGMNDLAKKLNIRIHGAYSCPNDHTFYFILESDDLKSISAFFSGIMLTNHKGRISPVISLKEASDTLIK
ncbi:MAG: hypothetical protein LUO81_01190 [Methanoregulaceae archaeon]|nr:hypothetical protein [Methanoregulaceae archaeon]